MNDPVALVSHDAHEKNAEREALRRDVEAFLAAGGTIQHLARGESSGDTPQYNGRAIDYRRGVSKRQSVMEAGE